MEKHKVRGNELKSMAKALVLEFMQASNECRPNGSGLKQAQIFRGMRFGLGRLLERNVLSTAILGGCDLARIRGGRQG